jgi:hypothetical protein
MAKKIIEEWTPHYRLVRDDLEDVLVENCSFAFPSEGIEGRGPANENVT